MPMRNEQVIRDYNARMRSMNAEQHKEAARECYEREEASFERSDTDGFLSQWASNLTAREHEAWAKIRENDGKALLWVLKDGDRTVKAKKITTKYGVTWLLSDEETSKYGRRFVPVGARSRVQKSLGLHEAEEWLPAYATITGSGTGLSGAATCRVVTLPDYRAMGWDF